MVTSTATPSAALETASGELVLRVCGSSRHGQVVRLRSAKCTIGSGPRCTLRLRARGVRPIHCLIVRGSAGTVIRRWSLDTRLNGRAFTDAELVEGDRLSVGTIELEVVDPGRRSSPNLPESRVAPPQQPPSPPVPGPDRSETWKTDRLTARLTLANRQGRQRARRLVEKLRRANQEAARLRQLQDERAELERQWNEQAEAINARKNDLDLQQESFERQRREWNAKLAELEEQLRQRGEQLDADQAELKSRQENFERELRESSTKLAETEQQLRERGEQVDADRAELKARQEDFRQCRRQWETQHAAITPQEEQAREEPLADSQQPQQPEPPEAPGEEPIDISEVFRRLGSAELPSEEEPPETPAEPGPQPEEAPTANQPAPLAQAPEDRGEESIEDYMSRLMDRVQAVRGSAEREDGWPEQSAPERSAPELPVEPAVVQEAPRFEKPAAPRPSSPPEQPVETAPRAVAPESGGLTAMRELANLSAHNAIDRHARRQSKLASCGKLLVVVVGLAVGTALLWIWWTRASSPLILYAAMASFVVALFWGVQFVGLAGRRMFGKSPCEADRSDLNWQCEVEAASDRGQQVRYGGPSDPPPDESTRALEHELKTLIDARRRK